VHVAFERHDMGCGIPEVDPAPQVELRGIGQVEAQLGLLADEAQQEPHLLLADAGRALVAPHETPRQPIAKPARCGTDDLDVLGSESGFFTKFAIHRLERRLVAVHAALRELPAIAECAPRPEDAAIIAHEDDAYIRTVAIRVDQRANSTAIAE